MIWIVRAQPHAAVRAASDPTPFSRFWAMEKPILAPEPVNSGRVDLLFISTQHGSDASVSVARISESKFLNTPGKSPIPVWILRLVSFR